MSRTEEPVARLRRALDPSEMSQRLAASLGPVRGLRVLRLYPDWRGGYVILYGLGRGDGDAAREEVVFGRLAGEDAEQEAAALRALLARKPSGGDGTMPVVALADPGLVLQPLGVDPRLPGIALLRKPGRFVDQLRSHAATAPPVEGGRFALLSHRLGRRCTLRFHVAGPGPRSLIVKLFRRPERARRAFATLAALHAQGFATGAVRVPAPVALLEEAAILVMEDAPGVPLLDVPSDRRVAIARAGGAALARLHAAAAPEAGAHGPAEELATLARWCDLAARLRPEMAAPIAASAAAVRAGFAGLGPPPHQALLHRDLHERQILASGQVLSLLDFDTLARGEPALDLGNLLAHLALAGEPCQGELAAGFLAGYGLIDRAAARRLEVWTSAALLRLACIHGSAQRDRLGAFSLLGSELPEAA